jgi:hypothetical protein
MNKYEQLIEHIINDNEQAARELFHDIVVERSRNIYESIMDEEAMEEELGGNQVSGLVDEITQDETDGLEEDDGEEFGGEEEPALGGDEMDHDFGDEGGEEMGHDDMGGEEGDLEDKFRSIEDALEDLKAEFAELTGDHGDEGEEEMGHDEMGHDEMAGMAAGEVHGGEKPAEIGADHGMMEGEQPEWLKKKGSGKSGSDIKGSGKSGSAMSGKSGKSGKSGSAMSESELMREYVEKIQDFYKGNDSEGHTVGTGGNEPTVNTTGIVAGKNDMGGTASNIAKGGSNDAPDGNAPKGKAGGFVKPAQEIDVAKRNVNKPGGNKGAQDWYNTKAKAKAGEGQFATNGSVPVNKSSIEGGKK